MELADHFWAKVNKNGPVMPNMTDCCWMWVGAIGSNGRGRMTIRQRSVLSTVVAVFLETGSYPTACVLHKCDNGLCVRYTHLFQGTRKDNTQDMIRKGRRGKCGRKLSNEQVAEIRSQYLGMYGDCAKLARRYNVSIGLIWLICKNKTR